MAPTISSAAISSNEGIMITSDYNFIDVDFFVEYRITEPVKYLYTSQEPVLLMLISLWNTGSLNL